MVGCQGASGHGRVSVGRKHTCKKHKRCIEGDDDGDDGLGKSTGQFWGCREVGRESVE